MSALENRAPTTIWSLRRDPSAGYVRTEANDLVLVALPLDVVNGDMCGSLLSRADARLLAKRLNACLDGTLR